jgi:hypothetical protein
LTVVEVPAVSAVLAWGLPSVSDPWGLSSIEEVLPPEGRGFRKRYSKEGSLAEGAKKDRHRHPEGERMTMAVGGVDVGRITQVAGPAFSTTPIPIETATERR